MNVTLFAVHVCIVSTGGSKPIFSIVFCMCYSASMYILLCKVIDSQSVHNKSQRKSE